MSGIAQAGDLQATASLSAQIGAARRTNRKINMQQVLRVVFWLLVAFAFAMAVLPHPPEVGIKSDKIQHIIAFITLSAIGSAAYPRHVWQVLVGLFAFGALIELTQMIPELHRDAEFMDWVADATATTVILLLAVGARKLAATRS